MKIAFFALFLAATTSPALANADNLTDLADKAATDEACVMNYGTSYMDIAANAWGKLEAAAADQGMDIFGPAYLELHTSVMTKAQDHAESDTLQAYCENLLDTGN